MGDWGADNIALEIEIFGISGGDDQWVFFYRFEDLGGYVLQVEEREWTA